MFWPIILPTFGVQGALKASLYKGCRVVKGSMCFRACFLVGFGAGISVTIGMATGKRK